MFDKAKFIETYALAEQDLEGTGLSWDLLAQVYTQHEKQKNDRYWDADIIRPLEYHLQHFIHSGVHFIRTRVKSPERCVLRLIIQAMEARRNNRELHVNLENYTAFLPDLIGTRLVYLFEPDWKRIHQGIMKKYGSLMKEDPVAFVGQTDPELFKGNYTEVDPKLSVQAHPYGGRHIEYYLTYRSPALDRSYPVELQVKSIYEEACTEVSSRLWVPRRDYSPFIDNNLKILRELSEQANRLATSTQILRFKFEEDLDTSMTDQTAEDTHQQDRIENELGEYQITDLDSIKQRLADGRTEIALKKLQSYLEHCVDHELYGSFSEDLLTLRSRFARHNHAIMTGLVGYEEAEVFFVWFNESMLTFVKELEKEKVIPFIHTSKV